MLYCKNWWLPCRSTSVGKASHPSAWWASRVQGGTLLHVWPSRGGCGSVLPDNPVDFCPGFWFHYEILLITYIFRREKMKWKYKMFMVVSYVWKLNDMKFITGLFFPCWLPKKIFCNLSYMVTSVVVVFNINEECHLKLFFLV